MGVALLFCASFALAQNPNVTITGVVQGANGLPAANATISLTPSQQFFVAGLGSASCNSYLIEINGTLLTCGDTVNFNGTTPAAPTNGYNVTFATSKSGTTDSVSAAVVGDGISTDCLVGTGIFSPCGVGNVQTGVAGEAAYYPAATASVAPQPDLSFSGTTSTFAGTVNIGATSPPGSCSPATGCLAFNEAATAGTPTSGQDYMRADSATHSLRCSFNGASEAACIGSGGVTGSGTTNSIPVWTSSTALGNSSLADNGTSVTGSESFTNQNFIHANNTPSGCSGCYGIEGSLNLPASTSGGYGALAIIATTATMTGSPVSYYGVFGQAELVNNGSPTNWAGVYGDTTTSGISGTVGTLSGVRGLGQVGTGSGGGQGSSILDGIDGQIAIIGPSTTNEALSATFYARAPSLTAGVGGITNHHYGLYMEDQTAGGGTDNPDPHGIYELGTAPNAFGGHINQQATGNWAGTCTMTSGACTAITFTAAFTSAPACTVTWTGTGTLTGILKSNRTTSGLTPASSVGSDTAQVDWVCFGNPN